MKHANLLSALFAFTQQIATNKKRVCEMVEVGKESHIVVGLGEDYADEHGEKLDLDQSAAHIGLLMIDRAEIKLNAAIETIQCVILTNNATLSYDGRTQKIGGVIGYGSLIDQAPDPGPEHGIDDCGFISLSDDERFMFRMGDESADVNLASGNAYQRLVDKQDERARREKVRECLAMIFSGYGARPSGKMVKYVWQLYPQNFEYSDIQSCFDDIFYGNSVLDILKREEGEQFKKDRKHGRELHFKGNGHLVPDLVWYGYYYDTKIKAMRSTGLLERILRKHIEKEIRLAKEKEAQREEA